MFYCFFVTADSFFFIDSFFLSCIFDEFDLGIFLYGSIFFEERRTFLLPKRFVALFCVSCSEFGHFSKTSTLAGFNTVLNQLIQQIQ